MWLMLIGAVIGIVAWSLFVMWVIYRGGLNLEEFICIIFYSLIAVAFIYITISYLQVRF